MQNEVEKSRSIPLLRKIFQRGNHYATELGRQREKNGRSSIPRSPGTLRWVKMSGNVGSKSSGMGGGMGTSGRIQRGSEPSRAKKVLGKGAGTRRVP